MPPYQIINSPQLLEQWCRRMAGVEWLALDTEFIAERYYQPLLCLVQIASPRGNFLIDPLANVDTQRFWRFVVEGEHITILHSGMLELDFCHRYTGLFPKHLFDTQIATGLVCSDYPAGYTNMVSRFLHISMPGTETRTNWKRRPLTSRQVAYALDDVIYLNQMSQVLLTELDRLGRVEWFESEMARWTLRQKARYTSQRWQRILGSTRWTPRELAIIHAIWQWRESVACQRDCPARHVLRDDLIFELAKRKATTPSGIRNIRGMERDGLRQHLPALCGCVSEALALPESACPQVPMVHHNGKIAPFCAILSSILGMFCHENQLAPALVGTPSDVRDWVAWRLGMCPDPQPEPPNLAQGWRAEVFGNLFEELISGKKLIRLKSPTDSPPIEFVAF